MLPHPILSLALPIGQRPLQSASPPFCPLLLVTRVQQGSSFETDKYPPRWRKLSQFFPHQTTWGAECRVSKIPIPKQERDAIIANTPTATSGE